MIWMGARRELTTGTRRSLRWAFPPALRVIFCPHSHLSDNLTVGSVLQWRLLSSPLQHTVFVWAVYNAHADYACEEDWKVCNANWCVLLALFYIPLHFSINWCTFSPSQETDVAKWRQWPHFSVNLWANFWSKVLAGQKTVNTEKLLFVNWNCSIFLNRISLVDFYVFCCSNL